MAYNKMLLYQQAYAIKIGTPGIQLFYDFDYDERSPKINMEFQHFHPFFEIFILMDTQASHIIEGKYFSLQQYDMVFIAPEQLHKSEYPPGKSRKRLVIDFYIPQQQPGMEEEMSRLLSLFFQEVNVYRFSELQRNIILEPLNDIFELGQTTSEMRDLLIHAKFLEFLCRVYEYHKDNQYQPEVNFDSVTQKIYTITAFIHANYTAELTLQGLSKQFFISPYYLSHQFKKVTGFTLINYVQMTRVRNAQQLLLYTPMKITDIASACGFTSFSQFNRVFNRFSGCSPSQYRTGKEQGNDDKGGR